MSAGTRRKARAGTVTDGAALPRLGFAPALAAWQRQHGRHHLPWQITQAQLHTRTAARAPALSLGARVMTAGEQRGPGGAVPVPDARSALRCAEPPPCADGTEAPDTSAKVLRDPYRVWLSEVMLQQTQVATVIPYFEAFLRAFPSVQALAAADSEQVMGLWAGLGYYSRARNLHAAARQVAAEGRFPETAQALEALPGVGRSTAAAIAVFGFGQRAAILDGNVKRVLCRLLAIAGDPASSAVQKRLWAHAETELPLPGAPAAELIAYTQGMMDLGAMVCTRTSPDCERCPVASFCRARAMGEVARYPAPRPRKAVPLREVHLLWLKRPDDGRVLLEVRPDRGLWGGLWSLPELPACPPADWLPAGEFRHVFTHFRMQARLWAPPAVQAGAMRDAWHEGVKGGVMPPPECQRWVDPAAPGQVPLPAPVRDFLGQVQTRLF